METPSALRYRSIFISDVHLGAVGCRTECVREFLDRAECEYLYLVGDILDFWVGARSRRWSDVHSDVVQMILTKGREGTHVLYCPGNHDEFLRRALGAQLGNVKVAHEFEHITADARRFLVVHGDLFDGSVTRYRFLAKGGAWCYEHVQRFSHFWNARRERGNKDRINFGRIVKSRVKRVVQHFVHFEESLARHAGQRGYDGVICGHVHKPCIRSAAGGVLYINSGDWVENATAVVEHFDGRLELIHWDEIKKTLPAPVSTPQESIQVMACS